MSEELNTYETLDLLFEREISCFEEARNTQTKADALIVLDHLAMIANKYAEYQLKMKAINKE